MKSTPIDDGIATSEGNRTNLLDFDRQELAAWFEEQGEKPFRASQVMKWIYHHGVSDFNEMTDLGKALRERLAATAEVRPPRVIRDETSEDGTRKWLLALGGSLGNAVEMVFIPEARRGTLCVSSQAGCMLNCRFCSTGAQGFSRNLTGAEIIGQVWLAARALDHHPTRNRRITNVVMMGMGEPLLNFDPVVHAMGLMRDDFGFGLSNRRVTLSTSGVIPGIDRLREAADVSLAVSLHAATDELRTELVPLNKKYPIDQLLAACRRYVRDKPRGKITFEYTLIDGVNDAPDQARQLVELLRDFPAKVNLIPFNPFPGTPYRRSEPAVIDRFWRVLTQAGMTVTVRRTRGDDIGAACGQLMGEVQDRTRRQAQYRAQLERLSA